MLYKITCKICYSSALKIEIIHIYIEAFPVCSTKFLLCILQKKSCFAYASRSLDANHTVVPIDFIH